MAGSGPKQVVVILVLILSAVRAAAGAVPTAAPPALVLAEHARPQATILLSEQATELEVHAPAELASYVHRMTGAKLPIARTEGGRTRGPAHQAAVPELRFWHVVVFELAG